MYVEFHIAVYPLFHSIDLPYHIQLCLLKEIEQQQYYPITYIHIQIDYKNVEQCPSKYLDVYLDLSKSDELFWVSFVIYEDVKMAQTTTVH
jgi:hypothetical protein